MPHLDANCTLSLTMSTGRRQSKRINKGKAPAPPDSHIDIEHPKRGRKRTAEGAVDEVDKDEEMGDGEGDPTPRKGKTSVGHPTFDVVVDSPPHTRPKQRLRVNEAGDAVSPPSAPGLTPVVWLGRGPVCSIKSFTFLLNSISDPGQMCAVRPWGTEYMRTAVGGYKTFHCVRILCPQEEAVHTYIGVVEHSQEVSP
jgi:hypothetical protein